MRELRWEKVGPNRWEQFYTYQTVAGQCRVIVNSRSF
jgi:hypothetical protein